MACLHPLPSAPGRRLFELLEQQQEPFMLDVYLKENGHSDRLLSPRSMCWPGSACKRLQRMASHGFRRRTRGGLLFKCMLSKFLTGNSIRKALRWDDRAPPGSGSLGKSPPADMRTGKINGTDEEEESDLQFSSTTDSVSGVSDEEALWKCLEEEDETKQHSPVSVLGLHSCEDSPVHVNQNISREDVSTFSLELQRKALDIFEELLQVAYTPAFEQITKAGVLQSDHPLRLRSKEVEDSVVDSHECSKRNHGLIHDEVTPCDRCKGDNVGTIGRLAVDELSNSWRNWMHFQTQVTDTGVQVDDAIFERMLEETVLEMLTGFPCTFVES